MYHTLICISTSILVIVIVDSRVWSRTVQVDFGIGTYTTNVDFFFLFGSELLYTA